MLTLGAALCRSETGWLRQKPSLAERLYDAACDLTRRPVLVAIPEPTPRTPPVFRLVKAFAPHPLHRAA